MFNILRISVFIAVMSLVTYSAQAQNVNSADDLLIAGQKAITIEQDYPKAISLLRRANFLSPGYTDVKILLGRAYQFNNQQDSARYFFLQARLKDPSNLDLLNYLVGLEYGAGKIAESISYLDSALVYHPQSESLLLKKASMLYDNKDYSDAQLVIDDLLAINSKNEKALRLNSQLNLVTASNKVSLYYNYSSFDKLFEPWHSTSVGYQKTTKIGSFGGHITYVNRSNGMSGLQYEFESYPKISKTVYGNFAVALSSGDPVFPEITARGALYKAVKSYEFEGGLRYVGTPSEKFMIYNAGISKYVSNFLLNFKAYFMDFEGASGQGYQFSSRYYYSENPGNVFIIGAGTGVAPDLTNRSLGISNVANLSGRRLFSEYRRVIKDSNTLSLLASIGHDEYTKTKSANQVTIGLGFQRKF
jgi:YaiO family outer membrane protein